MIEATDLHVSLGRRAVLHGVSMAARAGQITAIVGPNGSGKTTLLRVLTGELRGLGRVTLDGVPLAQMTAAALAQRRAVLPQAARLAFPFRLHEVVEMGQAAGRAAGRAGVVAAALRDVDLADRAGARFTDLSGGEQARGHLARALAQVWDTGDARQPAWLLLDEPVASLDIGHQLAVMDRVARFAAGGCGVLAVMHDLNLTAMFADHVVLMQDGQVRAAGAPAQVLTDALLGEVYRVALRVNRVPAGGAVFVLPQGVITSEDRPRSI